MTHIIAVPQLGESITEAVVARWFKKIGDHVEADEPIVEIETDKVTLEVPANTSGTIGEIYAQEGETVAIKQKLCSINENKLKKLNIQNKPGKTENNIKLAPSVNKIINENNIDIEQIRPTGEKGRISKIDAVKYLEEIKIDTQNIEAMKNKTQIDEQNPDSNISKLKDFQEQKIQEQKIQEQKIQEQKNNQGQNNNKIVPMTKLRNTIAKRLKKAQNEAAILSTFNDVDMTNVINIRKQYKQEFESKFNVKLGFMGFFVKAVVEALKQFPEINAEIKDDNIIYKEYYNIGVAVASDKGLVVPVIKNAQDKSIADIEKDINQYAIKAKNNNININDLSGGTFTISNGGVYGSLLSTPILNSPQSGILGMHRIQKQPVVIDDQIKIRHIMLIALSYDHRIVDGKEAVTFLNKVKNDIQQPQRILLGL